MLAKNPALTDAQREAIQQWGMALAGAVIDGAGGAAAALDSFNYNYLDHEQVAAFDLEMQACDGDAGCMLAVMQKYHELSADNDDALRACESAACRAAHLAEIDRARELAQTVLNPALSDPYYVAQLAALQSPQVVSASMHISLQREKALEEAREECGSDTACVEKVANERFNSWLDAQAAKQLIAGIVLATGGLRGNVTPIKVDKEGGIFLSITEGMPATARAYQDSVPGTQPGAVYLRNGVKFDGYDSKTGSLVEAKGNYGFMFDKNGALQYWAEEAYKSMLKQAGSQFKAAGGQPVTWYVQTPQLATNLREEFAKSGFNIKVINRP